MKKLMLLVLPMLFVACSSDDSNNNYVPPVTPPVDGVAYFSGNIDGVATAYTYFYGTGTDAYGYSNSSDGFPGETWYSYGGGLSPTSFDPSITIYWNNMYFGGSMGETENFYDNFATIPTNYVTVDQINAHVKGIEVEYAIDGDQYNSAYGSQAGSTFVVTSSSQGIEDGGTLKVKTIVGTLNCKLYNVDNVADVKTITNGSYKIVLREDL